MLRIGQVEATATQDGKYTDGSVAGGIAATRLRAAAFNAMQEELAHIVESAGLALDINDMTQVLKAIQKLTLSRANPFADIKSDGAAAISTALTNLGLGEAAKRDVGTGDNQIPDMGAFASGSGWFRLPGGYIIQFGTFSGNTTRFISGHFPIPFPNQPMVSVSVMSDAVQSDPSIPAPQVLSVNFEHISNSAWRVATSDISQQYRFSYISIGR
ncbi:tail fiber protein [Escherichia coli]|uniref:Tail fiber protein n=1 Tax=Escherichia coli TaxID=562 RepID=A0A377BG61_ECOLX|nr:tail fiber protein [Escherichia coli]